MFLPIDKWARKVDSAVKRTVSLEPTSKSRCAIFNTQNIFDNLHQTSHMNLNIKSVIEFLIHIKSFVFDAAKC